MSPQQALELVLGVRTPKNSGLFPLQGLKGNILIIHITDPPIFINRPRSIKAILYKDKSRNLLMSDVHFKLKSSLPQFAAFEIENNFENFIEANKYRSFFPVLNNIISKR